MAPPGPPEPAVTTPLVCWRICASRARPAWLPASLPAFPGKECWPTATLARHMLQASRRWRRSWAAGRAPSWQSRLRGQVRSAAGVRAWIAESFLGWLTQDHGVPGLLFIRDGRLCRPRAAYLPPHPHPPAPTPHTCSPTRPHTHPSPHHPSPHPPPPPSTPAHIAGVLFDAAQLRPPISPAISLAEPGPRAATRLWAALLESLIMIDTAVSCGAAVLFRLCFDSCLRALKRLLMRVAEAAWEPAHKSELMGACGWAPYSCRRLPERAGGPQSWRRRCRPTSGAPCCSRWRARASSEGPCGPCLGGRLPCVLPHLSWPHSHSRCLLPCLARIPGKFS